MTVFHIAKNTNYTVMPNHHLRNRELSLKAKGLLSQMLSLPEKWDYTLQGLVYINREQIDAIRQAVHSYPFPHPSLGGQAAKRRKGMERKREAERSIAAGAIMAVI